MSIMKIWPFNRGSTWSLEDKETVLSTLAELMTRLEKVEKQSSRTERKVYRGGIPEDGQFPVPIAPQPREWKTGEPYTGETGGIDWTRPEGS